MRHAQGDTMPHFPPGDLGLLSANSFEQNYAQTCLRAAYGSNHATHSSHATNKSLQISPYEFFSDTGETQSTLRSGAARSRVAGPLL